MLCEIVQDRRELREEMAEGTLLRLLLALTLVGMRPPGGIRVGILEAKEDP